MQVPGFEVHGKVLDRPTGPVWKATDLDDGNTVALKQIHPTSPLAGHRLGTVCLALARSPHPNIVRVHRLTHTEDASWLVGEWVDGVVLGQVPAATLTAQQVVSTISGALDGLAHAHSIGLVHGDVSPDTIVISAAGVPRVFDIALAGPMGATGMPSAPRFTSPESKLGQVLTSASDVYSAAGVLARMLTATPSSPSAPATSAPPLAAIPVPLRPVLNRALSPEPADRYHGAGEFLAELSRAADESFGFGWTLAAAVVPSLGAEVPRQRRASRRSLTRH